MKRPAPERIAEIRARFARVRYVEPYDMISAVIAWDLLAEIEALTAEHDRRAQFDLFSSGGLDLVCSNCGHGTRDEDQGFENLAEYNAWADQHRCEG